MAFCLAAFNVVLSAGKSIRTETSNAASRGHAYTLDFIQTAVAFIGLKRILITS